MTNPNDPNPNQPLQKGPGEGPAGYYPGQSYPGPSYPGPSYGPPPAYGVGPHYRPAPGIGGGPTPRNGLGITALILGIAAIVVFWTVVGGILIGLMAIVFGIIGFLRSKKGAATNGVMAIVGAVLGLLGVIGSIAFLLLGLSFFREVGVTDYVTCLNNADGNQAKLDQCERDLDKRLEDQLGITTAPPTP